MCVGLVPTYGRGVGIVLSRVCIPHIQAKVLLLHMLCIWNERAGIQLGHFISARTLLAEDMLRLIIEITCLDYLSLGSYDSTLILFLGEKRKPFSSLLEVEIIRVK